MPSAEEKRRRESSVEMVDGSVASSEGNEGVTRIDAISAAASIAPSTATTIGSTQPSSTSATSVSSVSIPSLEDQAHIIIKSKIETKLNEGDLGYVISGPWLNQLLAKFSDSGLQLTKEDAENEIGPIDNSDLVDATQMQGQARETSDDRENDEDSAVPEDFVAIKPGTLGDDFEILPEEAWNSLVSWYGLAEGSPVITRRAVDTSETITPYIQYEIHPPTFTLHKLRDPSTNITKDLLGREKLQSPVKITAGKTDGFQKLLRRVKKLAGVDAARKIRLWRIIENSSEHDLESTNKSSRKAGLGAGGPIVIEEQGSNGEWISEKPTKSVKKGGEQVTVALNGKNVTGGPGKKKVSSRPDSPSGGTGAAVIRSGFPNRPAERREGRPLGKCGLSNLGNTCYMNSALQCLRSVAELSGYFLSNKYAEELNPSNPLSHSGKVAKAYATLLGYIFSPTCPGSVSPREFKSTISRFSLSFSGYGQQDTQEFLAFLLDGLHEDLNRIQKKPYIEKPESTDEMVGDNEAIARLAREHWTIYKQRNDSVIADLFGGLYQSTLVCPDCEKVSITFDPFMDLTLPLPVENVWGRDIYFFPTSASSRRLIKIPVEMDKNSSIKSLKEHLARKFNLDPKKIMASEVYKGKFFKHYEDFQTVSETIRQDDDAFFYELDDAPTNYPPSKGKKPRRTGFYGPSYVFGLPFFIVVNRDEVTSFDAIMRKIIRKYQVLTTRNFYESEASPSESETEEEAVEVKGEPEDITETEEETDDGFVDVSMKDASSMVGSDGKAAKSPRRPLPAGIQDLFTVRVTKRRSGDSAVVTGWQSLETAFDIRERLNREQSASPPRRKTSGYFTNERKRKGIHLEDCLDEFAKEEILSEEDPWFCPRCKVHRRASKKLELWKCPDILVIHLKRFSSSRNFRDKIDALIDCPVTGLDLQERVGLKEEGKSLVYDLIAVDNHYGGLGGGHYTAFAKSWIDGKWYHYDDSSVREVSEQKVITPAAYLLFYRRRSETTLGGPRLNRILSESTNSSGSASSSRNTSPTRAGEGGPSDDSSATVLLNGRSSGGGTSGLPTIYSSAGNANLWGDDPPPYSESSGLEMVLVPRTQGSPASSKAPTVGFGFGSSLADKDELLRDSGDDRVFIGPLLDPVEQTDTPTDIRVDDDGEGLLPTLSDGKNDATEAHNAADNMES
ncbi:UCH-domain-containing protein [Tuber magnatum]|uniref:ubiquitinyl hydrolase 1 n=1 Tax=Tuber magnatum TaxID=42249 RepID=A0A317SSN8_9PEZI|nr:UCH-domain-containing protein [Tuber magnatum]